MGGESLDQLLLSPPEQVKKELVMNNTWIKSYRKTLDNEIYKHNPTAWRVFFHLLLLVNRKTGKRDIGRFQLARELGIKPTTAYYSLLKLKKAQMIDIKSNNRFSTIYICNWHKYQSNNNTPIDNKLTTN